MTDTTTDRDTISITWHVDDVLAQAANDGVSLTTEEARDLLAEIGRKHDASIGINWQVISEWVTDYDADRREADPERGGR